MIFNDAKSILKYIKSIMVINEIQIKDLANSLHISESALSSRLKQDNISVNLLLETVNSLGFVMDITFIDKKNISEPTMSQQNRFLSYYTELEKSQNKSGTDL